MFFFNNHGEDDSELVRLRSSTSKELLNITVEQLLSMCRFENKAKLDDLRLEIEAEI